MHTTYSNTEVDRRDDGKPQQDPDILLEEEGAYQEEPAGAEEVPSLPSTCYWLHPLCWDGGDEDEGG